jgi:hypothetical protein
MNYNEKSTKWLIKEADRVFSMFIRQRDEIDNRMGYCCTCKKPIDIKYNDCGHGIQRENYSTRYDERNCMLQCKVCNNNQGEQAAFAKEVDKRFGAGTWEQLEIKKHNRFKREKFVFIAIIEEYTNKIKANGWYLRWPKE